MDLVSPRPFWPVKNGLLHSYPALDGDLSCEVLVLGGGITGALMAWHLVKAGLDVVVVDKRDVASGSTSASTAMLQYEIDTPLTELTGRFGRADAEKAYRVCLESIGTLSRICDDIGDRCGFTDKVSVYLATKEREVKPLRVEWEARRRAGIDVDFLSKSDVSERFSFSRPAALLSHQAAEVDVYRLAHRLLMKSQEMGVRIFDRTEVKDYFPEETGFRAVTEGGHTIRSRWAVFATGYETAPMLDRRIVNLNSSYAVVSEPLKEFTGWWKQCLIWETARPYLYLRTTSDGRAIVGGEDDRFRNASARDARVSRKGVRLEKRFREMFPGITFEPAYAWAGTFGETKDGLAFIGAVAEVPSAWFALGFGGNGITYSVIAAEIIRDAICGTANENAHLFRFGR